MSPGGELRNNIIPFPTGFRAPTAEPPVRQIPHIVRAAASRAFSTGLSVLNRRRATPRDAELLGGANAAAGCLEATCDLDRLRDCRGAAGVVHLPALTRPRSRVRLRADVGSRCGSHGATARGVLATSHPAPLIANVPTDCQRKFFADLNETGVLVALWVGTPSLDDLLGGWVEGRMLALAQHLSRVRNVALFPVLTAVEAAAGLWGSWPWLSKNIGHPLLAADILFIPDLQVDGGDAWDSLDQADWWWIEQIVACRVVSGRKTFVGVQNLDALSEGFLRLVHTVTSVYVVRGGPVHPAPSAFAEADESTATFAHRHRMGLDLGCLWKNPTNRRFVATDVGSLEIAPPRGKQRRPRNWQRGAGPP